MRRWTISSSWRRGTGVDTQLLINFASGRTGVVNVYTNADTPFAAAVTTAQQTCMFTVDDSRLFIDMASAILDLFDSGAPGIDRAESLMIRHILDVAQRPETLERFVPL